MTQGVTCGACACTTSTSNPRAEVCSRCLNLTDAYNDLQRQTCDLARLLTNECRTLIAEILGDHGGYVYTPDSDMFKKAWSEDGGVYCTVSGYTQEMGWTDLNMETMDLTDMHDLYVGLNKIRKGTNEQ